MNENGEFPIGKESNLSRQFLVSDTGGYWRLFYPLSYSDTKGKTIAFWRFL